MKDFSLFTLNANRSYSEAIAAHLNIGLAAHEEREFEDGEHKIRPLQSVRGHHVFVIASLYSDSHLSVNDKLCRLIMFTGALRDASAREITLVLPYLAYARKDRRTQPRDPVSIRYLASIIEAVGTDRVMTLEAHNPAAFENAFRCVTEHLEALPLFIHYLSLTLGDAAKITVVSPDTGGYKRAQKFRLALSKAHQMEINSAFVEKLRSGGKLTHGRLVGTVNDSTVLIIDDMIVSGSTLCHAAQSCKQNGANKVIAIVTHGMFSEAANSVLDNPAIDEIIITDTVPPWRPNNPRVLNKLTVLKTAQFIADAIQRVYSGESLTDLLTIE